MSDRVDRKVREAFASPSALADRLRARSPRSLSPARSQASVKSAGSSRSRRTPSLITGPDKADLFDTMSQATSVKISKKKNRVEPRSQVSSPVDDIMNSFTDTVNSALAAVRSFSPTIIDQYEKNAPPINSYDEPSMTSQMSRLDPINNDNSFHVLATMLVDYFQSRLVNGKLILEPSDRVQVQRLLPSKAVRRDFIQAVKSRLERIPTQPATHLHYLTLQCEEYGLDREGTDNPIIAAINLESMSVVIPTLSYLNQKRKALVPATDKSSQPPKPSEASASETVQPDVASEEKLEEPALARNTENKESEAEAVNVVQSRSQTPTVSVHSHMSGRASQATNVSVHSHTSGRASQATISRTSVTAASVASQAPSKTSHADSATSASIQNASATASQGSKKSVPPVPTMSVQEESRALTQYHPTFHPAAPGAEQAVKDQIITVTQLPAHSSSTHGQNLSVRLAPTDETSKTSVASKAQVSNGGSSENENIDPLEAALLKQKQQLAVNARDISLEREGALSPENLARQQLLAELREASNLMAESVTPEIARFWRDHVIDLQARLRALHGESPRSMIRSTSPRDSGDYQRGFFSDMPQRVHYRESYAPPPAVTTKSPASGIVTATSNLSDDLTSSPSKTQQKSPHKHIELLKSETMDMDYDSCLVDVVAPADLPGGYNFEAEVEGKRFLATVPPGGVQQGETFTCIMRELGSVAIDIPVGYWKDGTTDLCAYGCCHAAPWNALFCPLIGLAQVQHRINLDFIGRPRVTRTGIPNRSMMISILSFWALINIAIFGGYNFKWSRGLELSIADMAAFGLINIAMFGLVIFIAQSTRTSLREKFLIREERCYDLEDLCCATWCLPCTVAQMMRHTANYDDYEAVCCSKTGLPDGVRVNEPMVKGTDYVV